MMSIVLAALLLIGTTSASSAISLPIIITLDAWAIKPDGTVEYQTTYNHASDPAGISMDEDSALRYDRILPA